jgi:hypothetical protein
VDFNDHQFPLARSQVYVFGAVCVPGSRHIAILEEREGCVEGSFQGFKDNLQERSFGQEKPLFYFGFIFLACFFPAKRNTRI